MKHYPCTDSEKEHIYRTYKENVWYKNLANNLTVIWKYGRSEPHWEAIYWVNWEWRVPLLWFVYLQPNKVASMLKDWLKHIENQKNRTIQPSLPHVKQWGKKNLPLNFVQYATWTIPAITCILLDLAMHPKRDVVLMSCTTSS